MRELFRTSREATKEEKINSLHIMIVGGGATGTELAGAIAAYSKTLARMHDIDRSFVTIDLIDSGPRILKYLHKSVSDKAERRLRRLGINIFLHRRVVRKEIEDVYLRDMRLKTLTVVWAAGVKANHLLAKAEGLSLDGAGRVIVDEFLRPKGFEGVFVIGDAASTVYSGLAQTALSDAKYVAECIKRKIKRMKLVTYEPKKPAYAIPIGPGWAAVIIGPFGFYGKIGWLLRRIADMRFLLSILPPRRVLGIFLKKSYRS
jgi:NADH dehydrogenase